MIHVVFHSKKIYNFTGLFYRKYCQKNDKLQENGENKSFCGLFLPPELPENFLFFVSLFLKKNMKF